MLFRSAIVPQGGRQFVWRLVDGPDQDTRIAQRVEVKVGTRQPGKVEITQGLAAGDTVVTAGQQRITKDGTPVRVLDLKGPVPGANGAAAAGGAARAAPAPVEMIASTPGNPCAVASGAPGGRSAPAGKTLQRG